MTSPESRLPSEMETHVSPAPVSQPPISLAFDSLTGNVRRFVAGVQEQLEIEALDVKHAAPDRAFVLVTYTFGNAQVPETTARFLAQHGHLMLGVVASGSFHWGRNFGRAGHLISEQYQVPLIAKINKSGNAADRETVLNWLLQQTTSRSRRTRS